MKKKTVCAVFAAAVASASQVFAAFPPPITADPINTSLATIGTNYNQTQTYSHAIGFDLNTFTQNPDVLWYQYVSDGQTAVRFDTLGSNIQTQNGGGVVLGSSNETQIFVYTATGGYVAHSGGTVALNGDPMAIYPTFSNDPGPSVGGGLGTNQYTPEELTQFYLAPTNSTNPHWAADPNSTTKFVGWAAPGNGTGQAYNFNEYRVWSTALYQTDSNGNLILDSHGQPIYNPSWKNGNYDSVGPGSGWNRYQVLPAGTYYLAVASVSPTLAGDQYKEAILQAPVNFNYDDLKNEPVLTGPLGTWQYYIDPSSFGFAGTVQLNVTQAPVQTNTVSTLTGNANMTLNATTLVVTNGGNYGGILQDGTFQGLLVLTGGTLTLTGNNTLSGGITLAGGELSVASDSFLGDPTQSITFVGGTLGITGTTDNTTARPLHWTPAGGGFDITDAGNTYTVTSVFNGGGLTKAGAGTLILTKAYTTTSPTTIAGGTLQLTPATGTTAPANNSVVAGISGAGNLSVVAGASLVADGISLNGLSIGGTVQVRSNGTSTGTTKVNSLVLAGATDAWTGGLDITNNKLIVEDTTLSHGTTLSTLQNQIKFGKSHAAGVYSSTGLPANLAMAVLDNAVLNKTSFGGASVDAGAILIGPELLGDANADGHVDLTDLSTVLNNFGSATVAWTSGNFDGAVTIDLTDLSDVLNNFGLTYANASNAQAVIAAPEPASISIAGLALLPLLRRNRKR